MHTIRIAALILAGVMVRWQLARRRRNRQRGARRIQPASCRRGCQCAADRRSGLRLSDIGKWWDPEHTYSGDARNLSLDPVLRGCFCEKLSLYAGIEHAHVVYAQPAKTLRLIGSLGPLQEFGVTGSMTWQIEAAGGGSRITVTYNVGGFADRPLADWAPIVDEVVGGQVKRLGRFVATGNPAEAKPKLALRRLDARIH